MEKNEFVEFGLINELIKPIENSDKFELTKKGEKNGYFIWVLPLLFYFTLVGCCKR